jgi:hypothetical protein
MLIIQAASVLFFATVHGHTSPAPVESPLDVFASIVLQLEGRTFESKKRKTPGSSLVSNADYTSTSTPQPPSRHITQDQILEERIDLFQRALDKANAARNVSIRGKRKAMLVARRDMWHKKFLEGILQSLKAYRMTTPGPTELSEELYYSDNANLYGISSTESV